MSEEKGTTLKTDEHGNPIEEPGDQSLEGDGVEDLEAGGEEGKEPEPMVTIGDEEVPLSVAMNGVKLHREFTQSRAALLEDQRKVDEAKQAAASEAASLEPLRMIANILADPTRAEQLTQAVPGLKPVAEVMARTKDAAAAVENLGYRFDAWAASASDLELEEKRAVGVKVMEIAKSAISTGDTNLRAINFETIKQDLFRDKIIDREAQKRADELLKKQEKQRAAGTLPPGAPPRPRGSADTDGMTPKQKMAYGRRQKDEAARRGRSS